MREHTIKFKGKQTCDDVYSGLKKFEYRLNDRDYRVGDLIHPIPLDENDQEFEHPLRGVTLKVLYILYGPSFGIPEGYCIFTIEDVNKCSKRFTFSNLIALLIGALGTIAVYAALIQLIR